MNTISKDVISSAEHWFLDKTSDRRKKVQKTLASEKIVVTPHKKYGEYAEEIYYKDGLGKLTHLMTLWNKLFDGEEKVIEGYKISISRTMQDKIKDKKSLVHSIRKGHVDETKDELTELELGKIKGWINDIIAYYEEKGNTTSLSQKASLEAMQKKQELIRQANLLESEIADLHLEGATKEAIVKVRVNQGAFRDLLLERYKKCCLCGVSHAPLLVASHIKPWAESLPEEKLEVDNGFLMCPNHDKLFDQGYISFDDQGTIIISPQLPQSDCLFTNIQPGTKIQLTEGNKKYLQYHREHIFKEK